MRRISTRITKVFNMDNTLRKTVNTAADRDGETQYEQMKRMMKDSGTSLPARYFEAYFTEKAEGGKADAWLQLSNLLDIMRVNGAGNPTKKENIAYLENALDVARTTHDHPTETAALNKLRTMKTRIEAREALRAAGRPQDKSPDSEEIKAYTYAMEKADQDAELAPVISHIIDKHHAVYHDMPFEHHA